MEQLARKQAGVPAGGQFSPRERAESPVALAVEESFTASTTDPKRGQWTIYDPTVVATDEVDVYAITEKCSGGQPHMTVRARVAAVLLKASHPGLPDFGKLAENEEKVTVLSITPDGVVRALEGTVVLSGESPILVRKGATNHAWALSDLDVIGYEPGFHGQDALAAKFTEAMGRVPRTEKFDADVIPLTKASARRVHSPNVVAVFLVDVASDDATASLAGSIFLATGRDGDTVHGHLWTPDNAGTQKSVSSITIAELTATAGAVVGFRSGAMSIQNVTDGGMGTGRAEAYKQFVL
jgi:hypothetical protein